MFSNGRYIGPWYQQADPPGGTGSSTPPDPPENPPKPADPLAELTPEQQAALDRRTAAARREGESTGKTKAAQEAQAAADADKAERERKEQEARGEFDKVRQSIEVERDGFKADLDTTKGRLDRALELLKSGVQGKVDSLTKADPELAKAFPADADVLDQIAWLDDPRTKAVIDRVDAEVKQATAPKGNGRSAQAADGQNPVAEEKARREFARQNRTEF
jgi:hypothetical protein